MSSFRASWLMPPALALVFSLVFVSLPALGRSQAVDHLVISEVMYDPAGEDPAGEWVEVFNPTVAAIELVGWKLVDNASQDIIPSFVLQPREYLVVAAQESVFRSVYPDFTGNLVSLEGTIGNGLSNTSDRALLVDASGQWVDAMSYGGDASAFEPPCPAAPEGQSLARVPPDQDTDTAADWAVQEIPSPGAPPATVTLTATPSPSPTSTWTSAATFTPTSTPTGASTALVPTVTGTLSDVPTSTPTPTRTPSSTWTPTPTATGALTASPVAWPRLLLSEVLYDAPQDGPDSAWEWIEAFNASDQAVELAGWRIGDNAGQDAIPAFELPAGGYLVIAATLNGFRENHPDFVGSLVTLEGTIGNGLSDIGDVVRLIAPDGAVIDAMSYGTNTGAFDPPCPAVPAGQSLARVPSWLDTGTAADWIAQSPPNPGEPGAFPIPTPTPTPTPAATVTPMSRIEGYVFEDRNANGRRDFDEIGLGIAGVTITLRADAPDGLIRSLCTFPSGWYGFYDLPAGVYQVSEAQPAGYVSTTPDQVTVILDAGGINWGPNFGEQRLAPTPTLTGAPGISPTPDAAPMLLLSEVLYDAPQGGADSAWEWIEAFNPGDRAVDLTGWRVGDNNGQDDLPAFDLPAGGYLVIAATLAGFRENHPDFAGNLVTLEGSIGNGLSNTGDVVRLIAPGGAVIDAMSYGTNAEAFDPPCPAVSAGQSLARIPSWLDTDVAADWTGQVSPNPGGPGAPPTATSTPTPTTTSTPTPSVTPTPDSTNTSVPATATATATATLAASLTVRFNELLPRPDLVDWDGNGTVDAYDEWKCTLP